jgi:hypothetical protein
MQARVSPSANDSLAMALQPGCASAVRTKHWRDTHAAGLISAQHAIESRTCKWNAQACTQRRFTDRHFEPCRVRAQISACVHVRLAVENVNVWVSNRGVQHNRISTQRPAHQQHKSSYGSRHHEKKSVRLFNTFESSHSIFDASEFVCCHLPRRQAPTMAGVAPAPGHPAAPAGGRHDDTSHGHPTTPLGYAGARDKRGRDTVGGRSVLLDN